MRVRHLPNSTLSSQSVIKMKRHVKKKGNVTSKIAFSKGFGQLLSGLDFSENGAQSEIANEAHVMAAYLDADFSLDLGNTDLLSKFGVQLIFEDNFPLAHMMFLTSDIRIDWLADARDKQVLDALDSWRQNGVVHVALLGGPDTILKDPCVASQIAPSIREDSSEYVFAQSEGQFLSLAAAIIDSPVKAEFDRSLDHGTLRHLSTNILLTDRSSIFVNEEAMFRSLESVTEHLKLHLPSVH